MSKTRPKALRSVSSPKASNVVTIFRSVDEQLRFAIANKRLIEIKYSGRLRVAEPHDYGVHKRNPMLLAYQLSESGGTPRKGAVGWRLFNVSDIQSCVVRDDTFPGSRGESHRHHYTWSVLYARVS